MNFRLVPVGEIRDIQQNFERIQRVMRDERRIVRNFVDASAGAVTFSLPDGTTTDADYYIVKTDSSGNAVTPTAFGTQTIEGSATLALAAQYAACLLTFYGGVWYRIDA